MWLPDVTGATCDFPSQVIEELARRITAARATRTPFSQATSAVNSATISLNASASSQNGQ